MQFGAAWAEGHGFELPAEGLGRGSPAGQAGSQGRAGRAGSIACVLLGKSGGKRVKASKETNPVFGGSSASQVEAVNVASVKKWRLQWINPSKSHSLQVWDDVSSVSMETQG